MDTKWKGKQVSVVFLICTFLLWSLTLFTAADILTHRSYLEKDSYFKGEQFSREMISLYDLIRLVHIDGKDLDKKQPQEILGEGQYENLKSRADSSIRNKQANIANNYNSLIESARNKGETAEVLRLNTEKEAKQAEAKKEGDATFEQNLKTAIASKQKEYENSKNALDLRKNSVLFKIRNLNTGEIYTNFNTETPQISGIIYSYDVPIMDDSIRGLSMLNSDYRNRNLQGTFYIFAPEYGSGTIQTQYLYHMEVRSGLRNTFIWFGGFLVTAILFTIYARKEHPGAFALTEVRQFAVRRIPIDVRGWIAFIAFLMLFGITVENDILYVSSTYISLHQIVVVSIVAILLAIVVYSISGLFNLLKHENEFSVQWKNSITAAFWNTSKESLERRGLFFKLFVFMVIIAVLGILPAMLAAGGDEEEVIVVFCFMWYGLFLLFVLPYMLKKVRQLRAIIKGVEQMANGNFDVVIPSKGKGQLARLAGNINGLKQGLQLALENQRVSDRLKTELITNVSHDLKTPLTSIINYVDLLKKEGVTPEQSAQYIEVLDRKTHRLKVLIEDLFEASKMASGAAELHLAKVDLAALLNQALAEFSDKIEASSLTFRVNMEKPHVYALLDGRKTWRVFENLISNALKYSLPGTRVYLNLSETNEKVVMTMQNISAYEFNFGVEELFERFKRGDQSRQTEGSGLGLSIARSIVELQGGKMTIEIDGDQFKVITEFNKH